MQILAYLLARFSEPSSYAGLGALLALAGWRFPESAIGQLAQLLAAACGLLALLLKERGLIRAIVLVFAVVPLLSGCGTPSTAAGSAYTAVDKVTEAAAPAIASACADYGKAKAAADAAIAAGAVSASVAGKISSAEAVGDAACARPPAGDPLSTAVWLGQIVGRITTLTVPARPGA